MGQEWRLGARAIGLGLWARDQEWRLGARAWGDKGWIRCEWNKSTSVVYNKIRNCEEEWRCGRLPQTKTKTIVWVAGYFVDRTRGGLQPCVAGLPYKGWMSVMLLGGQRRCYNWILIRIISSRFPNWTFGMDHSERANPCPNDFEECPFMALWGLML